RDRRVPYEVEGVVLVKRLQLRLVAVVVLVDLLERLFGVRPRLREACDLGLRGVPGGLLGLDVRLARVVEALRRLVRLQPARRRRALRVLLLLGLVEVARRVHLGLPRAVELVRVVPGALGLVRRALGLRERRLVAAYLASAVAFLLQVLL